MVIDKEETVVNTTLKLSKRELDVFISALDQLYHKHQNISAPSMDKIVGGDQIRTHRDEVIKILNRLIDYKLENNL